MNPLATAPSPNYRPPARLLAAAASQSSASARSAAADSRQSAAGSQSERVTLTAQAQQVIDQPTKVTRALTDPAVAKRLQSFPAQFQTTIRGLSDAQFKVLGGTRPTDKDRERFVSGKAFGFVSIWDHVHKGISDAQSKYNMINPKEANGLHGLVDQVEKFTPAQRRELMGIMDRVRGD